MTKDEEVKSYRVMPGEELQINTGPGGHNQKMGRLRSRYVVTEFAAAKGWGCWIHISCELHPPEWVARIMRTDEERHYKEREHQGRSGGAEYGCSSHRFAVLPRMMYGKTLYSTTRQAGWS